MTSTTFRIGDKLNTVQPHHESIEALWKLKWKQASSNRRYPFHDGNYNDFKEVFKGLIKNKVSDPASPAYATAFFNPASRLLQAAEAALSSPPEAAALYLRAAALYRIARFPHHCSTILRANNPSALLSPKHSAWEAQKSAYLKGTALFPAQITEVLVPHIHATPAEGGAGVNIPVLVRLPTEKDLAPAILIITGLDGYRTDNTERTSEFLTSGWGSVVLEIPGTGDSPADPCDPTSGERLVKSVLDWMRADGRFDMSKIAAWALSCGAYEAVRIAHTLKDSFRGVAVQGAGVHHWLSKEWLQDIDGREYPFPILHCLAAKHGYESVGAFVDGGQKKFSLLENGILDLPCTRLFAINGLEDTLMPLEDSCLLTQHGSPKDVRLAVVLPLGWNWGSNSFAPGTVVKVEDLTADRLFPNATHMAHPIANYYIYPWLRRILAD